MNLLGSNTKSSKYPGINMLKMNESTHIPMIVNDGLFLTEFIKWFMIPLVILFRACADVCLNASLTISSELVLWLE